MNDFWTNISRYPRFFFSSLIGLLMVILAPFKNLLKLKKFQFVFPFMMMLVFSVLVSILKAMTST